MPPSEDDLVEGRRVLDAEASALTTLSGHLDAAFVDAVTTLANVSGRVIVTGMGKSGHVGAKMAATFASTGTPSYFVHPGEASHGDLGMISDDDAVIALSHRGGSRELGDVIAHTQRFGIPLIAITSDPHSMLGSAATTVINTLVTTEACPLELAPMTSTTVTLAIGDALAAALMQRRGFAEEDYARFHPGGKLGSKLARVDQLMQAGDALPLVTPETLMQEAIITMSTKSLGLLVVVDSDGLLLGLVTDGDLRRHMQPRLLEMPVREIMTADPMTIAASAMALRAVAQMQEKNITALVVTADASTRPVGVIKIQDCLTAGVI